MNEIDQIRQQMAQIRRDMHYAVSEVVEEAGEALDWRSYLREYPWRTVGAGLVVGYFLIPRKHRPEAPTVVVAPSSEELKQLVPQDTAAVATPPKRRGSLLGKLTSGAFGLLWPLAIRAGQAYAAGWIEKRLLAQQQYGTPQPPPTGSQPPTGGGYPGFSFTGAPTGAEHRPSM